GDSSRTLVPRACGYARTRTPKTSANRAIQVVTRRCQRETSPRQSPSEMQALQHRAVPAGARRWTTLMDTRQARAYPRWRTDRWNPPRRTVHHVQSPSLVARPDGRPLRKGRHEGAPVDCVRNRSFDEEQVVDFEGPLWHRGLGFRDLAATIDGRILWVARSVNANAVIAQHVDVPDDECSG